MSSVKVSAAEPVLPAASVSLATMVCAPSDRVGVKVQMPPLLTVVVPRVVEPSLIVTVAFGSPPPVSASFDVILSEGEGPVSDTRLCVTAGGVVSSVKVSEAEPVLPAELISLATMVCDPSNKPLGVNVQLPLLLAVAVLAIALPSTVKCTTALGSPEPVSASFDVILSEDDEPVSLTKLAVTCGAGVDDVKWNPRASNCCKSSAVSVWVVLLE